MGLKGHMKSGATSAVKRFILIASLIVMILVFVFLFFKQMFSPAPSTIMNTQKLLARIARHVTLPSGVVTIRRVERPDFLQDIQPTVYKGILYGDYIVEYPSAILIYRSDEDRLIQFYTK